MPGDKKSGIDVPVHMAGQSVRFLSNRGVSPTTPNSWNYGYAIFFNLLEAGDSAGMRLCAKSTAAWMKAVNSG